MAAARLQRWVVKLSAYTRRTQEHSNADVAS